MWHLLNVCLRKGKEQGKGREEGKGTSFPTGELNSRIASDHLGVLYSGILHSDVPHSGVPLWCPSVWDPSLWCPSLWHLSLPPPPSLIPRSGIPHSGIPRSGIPHSSILTLSILELTLVHRRKCVHMHLGRRPGALYSEATQVQQGNSLYRERLPGGLVESLAVLCTWLCLLGHEHCRWCRQAQTQALPFRWLAVWSQQHAGVSEPIQRRQ